jgi:hypothetical protein
LTLEERLRLKVKEIIDEHKPAPLEKNVREGVQEILASASV